MLLFFLLPTAFLSCTAMLVGHRGAVLPFCRQRDGMGAASPQLHAPCSALQEATLQRAGECGQRVAAFHCWFANAHVCNTPIYSRICMYIYNSTPKK